MAKKRENIKFHISELQIINALMDGVPRKEDIISRWGGDEIVCILTRTNESDAEKIIRRIKELCKEKRTSEMPLSISLGVSTKRDPSQNILDVLKEAEDKMYEDKIMERVPTRESHINSSLRKRMKKK